MSDMSVQQLIETLAQEAHKDIFKPLTDEEADLIPETPDEDKAAAEMYQDYMSLEDVDEREVYWGNLDIDEARELAQMMATNLIVGPVAEAIQKLFQNQVLKDHPMQVEEFVMEVVEDMGDEFVTMVTEYAGTL